MAKRLSQLTQTVVLDINKWTAGVKQMQRDQAALANSLKPVTQLTKQFGAAFTAVGLAVGGSLLGMAKKAADYGDAMLEASQKTGISTKELAGMKLVAEQSGASFESLSKGVGQLSKNITAAAAGNKEQVKLFRALGISVKDAAGQLKSNSAIMEEVADRFSKLDDGAVKTAASMKLFGKAGADLIPTLNQGSEGFRRAREQAEKFGLAVTEAEASLGDKFNDAIGSSKAAMQGFANAVGVALLPKLTELVNKANDWIAAASRWVKAHPELTSAIAKTAAAIFAAGGLLLGLTAILTIAPKVYSSVMLMAKGFQAIMAFAGLKSVLAGIGTQAAATAAGTSALGLSVGKLMPLLLKLGPAVGLVGLAFAGLAISKKVSDVLGFTDAMKASWPEVQKLAANLKFLAGELAKIVQSNVLAFLGTMKDLFVQIGSVVPLVGKEIAKLGGIFEFIARPIDTFQAKVLTDIFVAQEAIKRFNNFLQQIGPTRPAATGMGNLKESEGRAATAVKTGADKATEDAKKFQAELEKAFGKTGDAADKTANEIKALQESFASALRPADDLEKVIGKLRANVKGITDEQIITVYGDQINAAATAQRAHGFAISDNMRLLDMQVVKIQALAEAEKNLADVYSDLAQKMEKERDRIRGMSEALVSEIRINNEGITPQIEAILEQSKFNRSIEEATKSLDDQQQALRKTAAQIVILKNNGMSAAQIETALGVSLERVADAAKELGTELDPVTRKTIEQTAAADRLSRSWGESFARLSDELVDMIVDFDFSFRRLKDIATNTAKDMARSFLDGFFKPFKDGLRGLGEEAGKWAAGLLFGTQPKQGQQKQGGLFGDLIGNAGGLLSGIFVGGKNKGQPQGSVTDILMGNVLAGLKTPGQLPGPGGGGLLGGLLGKIGLGGAGGGVQGAGGMAMPMDPITAALQAFNLGFDAVTKVTDKIGKGRDSADEIIKSQNAFVNQTLKGILADADLSATNKLKLVMSEWETFQQALTRYAAGGGENPVTANQAFATLSPLVANIQRDLIKSGASESAASGGGDTITVENLYVQLKDIHTPEELMRWIKLDLAGLRTEIIRANDLSTGLVPTH